MFKVGEKILAVSNHNTRNAWKSIMGYESVFPIKIGEIYTIIDIVEKSGTYWDKMGYLLYIGPDGNLVHPQDFDYLSAMRSTIAGIEAEMQ